MSVADPALQAASSTGPSRGVKAPQLSNSGFLGARRPQKQEGSKISARDPESQLNKSASLGAPQAAAKAGSDKA